LGEARPDWNLESYLEKGIAREALEEIEKGIMEELGRAEEAALIS
jgi:hypothetical protein